MNKTVLVEILQQRKVPKGMYDLNGGLLNEVYTLGSNNNIWEVYYSEKGLKSGLKIFNTEDEACNYFLEIVLRNI